MKQLILLIVVAGLIAMLILLAMAAPKWAEARAQEAQARQVEAQAQARIAEARAEQDIVFTLAVCALLALALLVLGLPLAVLLGALLAIRAVRELAAPMQVYQLPDSPNRAQLDQARAIVYIPEGNHAHRL